MHDGVEVGDDARGDGGSQAVVLSIDDLDLGVEALQEGEGTRVHGARGALGHKEHVGLVLLGKLEGTVEVLAGVVARGVDPLHLAHEEHRGGIGHLGRSARAHDVDDLIVLEGLAELLGGSLSGLGGSLHGVVDTGEAGDHVVVQVGALNLLQQLDRQIEHVAQLLALGCVVGLKAVHDAVVGLLEQGALGVVRDRHDGGAMRLGGRVGGYGLGRAAAEGAGDDHGIVRNPGRRVVVELVGREDLDVERLGVVGEEVLCGIQLGHGSAAAHKGDVLDAVLGDDLRNDLFSLVHIDLVHLGTCPFYFAGNMRSPSRATLPGSYWNRRGDGAMPKARPVVYRRTRARKTTEKHGWQSRGKAA